MWYMHLKSISLSGSNYFESNNSCLSRVFFILKVSCMTLFEYNMRYISLTWKIYVDLEYIQLEYFVLSSNIQSVLNAKNLNHMNKLSDYHGPLYLVLDSYLGWILRLKGFLNSVYETWIWIAQILELTKSFEMISKLTHFPGNQKEKNPLSNFCVGVWVGEHHVDQKM